MMDEPWRQTGEFTPSQTARKISRHERAWARAEHALYEHYSIHDSTCIIPVDARTASYLGIAILSRSFGVPTVYSCTICDKQLAPTEPRRAARARGSLATTDTRACPTRMRCA